MRFGDDFFHRTANRIMGSGWVVAPHPIYIFRCHHPLPPSTPLPLSVLIGSGRYSFLLIRRSSSGDFRHRDIKSYLFMYIIIFKPLLLLLHPMTHL